MSTAYTLWFTGIPSSGKSCLASALHRVFLNEGLKAEYLDSDTFVRELGDYYTGDAKGREMNNHVMAVLSAHLNGHGVHSIVAATSPNKAQRKENRKRIGNYMEIYCDCSLEVAETRGKKGLYTLSRLGFISGFPGGDAPYDVPESPDLVLRTDAGPVEDTMKVLTAFLKEKSILP